MDLSKQMRELKDLYVSKGYSFINASDELHLVFEKDVEEETYLLMIIGPHEGNDYQWLTRGDPAMLHDKWGNAMYQNTFQTFEELKENWNKWFQYLD